MSRRRSSPQQSTAGSGERASVYKAHLGLQPLADDASALLAVDRPSLGKDAVGDAVAFDAERVLNDLAARSASLQLRAWFLTLIQSSVRPARYGEPSRFDAMLSQPSARMRLLQPCSTIVPPHLVVVSGLVANS